MNTPPHDSTLPSLYSLVFEELCELARKKGESFPSSEWIIFVTRLAPKGLQGNLSPREKKRLGKSRIALMERRCRQAMRKWPRVFQEACQHLHASRDRETVFRRLIATIEREHHPWTRVVKGNKELEEILVVCDAWGDNAWLCGDDPHVPGLYDVTVYWAD